jgi:membrane fusion protein, adhesin transport system
VRAPFGMRADPTGAGDDLDGADELLDGRAPAFAGFLVASVAALFVALVGWLAWAEVEEVVRAAGEVEPAGRVKIVNHPRGGRVAEIHVREGERVEAGAPLVTLDGEVARSERGELAGRLQLRMVEVARLEAEAEDRALQVDPPLERARPDLVAAQRALLEARGAAQVSRRGTLEKATQARGGELRTAAAEVGRLRNSLTLLKQQREAVKALAECGLYPALKVVQVERQFADNQGELAKAEAAVEAAQAALAESESRLEGLERDRRSEVLAELAAATADRDRLAEQLRGQEAILSGLVVAAPAPGIVQEIVVASAGQAVAAHETLMKLVPESEGLVVEARVANQDIGRLRPGMPATVKVRAFDYLRYGSLDGVLQKVAADASPDPRTGELAYAATVITGRSHFGRQPGDLDVVPGMVVDVELKVGERTILSYLTDRIFRLQEAFREG